MKDECMYSLLNVKQRLACYKKTVYDIIVYRILCLHEQDNTRHAMWQYSLVTNIGDMKSCYKTISRKFNT